MKNRDSEFISIAELAGQVGKTRQWVYRMIEKPEIAQYVRVIDGKKKVHKSVAWRFFENRPDINVDGVDTQELKPETPEQTLLQILREQLQAKDQQLSDAQDALRREQILHAETAARLKETTARLEALEDKQAVMKQDQTDNAAAEQERETVNNDTVEIPVTEQQTPEQQQPAKDPDPDQQVRRSIFQRLAGMFTKYR